MSYNYCITDIILYKFLNVCGKWILKGFTFKTKVLHPLTPNLPKFREVHSFLYVKTFFYYWKPDFSENKTLNQHSGANLKKRFLLNFASNFLLFLPFQLFAQKNVEKANIDQR